MSFENNSTDNLGLAHGGISGVVNYLDTTGVFSAVHLTAGNVLIGTTSGNPVSAALSSGNNISITSSSGSITIAASQGQVATNYTYVTGNYPAVVTDYYLSVNSSASAITITLPTTPTTNHLFVIKDRAGNAANNNITIICGGSTTIDLTTTYAIKTSFESIQLLYNPSVSSNYEVY